MTRPTLEAPGKLWLRPRPGSAAGAMMLITSLAGQLSLADPALELADLNGSNGIAFHGVAANDQASQVASADVNDDGVADLIIGASGVNGTTGAVYVVFGQGLGGVGASFELSALNGANGFRIDGVSAGDFTGNAVSTGDINNDGEADIIIGARGADAVYVVFGDQPFPAVVNLANLGSPGNPNGFVINSVAAGDALGFSVGSSDVNGGGGDDLIIGAPGANAAAGATYVVFGGQSFSPSPNLATLDGTDGFVVNGAASADLAGFAVDGLGDINDDNLNDLIIGGSRADPSGDSSGAVYVIFGQNSFPPTLELSTLASSDGAVINGAAAGDQLGNSVAGLGDVNNDTIADLIVGAPGVGTNSQGAAYVVFGNSAFPATLDPSTLDGSDGFVINAVGGDSLGTAVSGMGDFNGDGFKDILVGGFRADGNNGNNAGASYVVFGRNGGFSAALELSTLTNSQGVAIHGEDGQDFSGGSLSGVMDINGDNLDDLLTGANQAEPNGSNSGAVYLVNGGAANLILDKSDTVDPITPGSGVPVYTLQVANAGPSPASNVQITDTLPTNTTFNSASGTGWSCSESGGVVTCDLANPLVGVAPPVTLTLDSTDGVGSYSNTATVAAATFDPNETNNTDTEVTSVDISIFRDGYE